MPCVFVLCGGAKPQHDRIAERLQVLYPQSQIVQERLVHFTGERPPPEVADSELLEHLWYLLNTTQPLVRKGRKKSERTAYRGKFKFTTRETAQVVVVVSGDKHLLAHANRLVANATSQKRVTIAYIGKDEFSVDPLTETTTITQAAHIGEVVDPSARTVVLVDGDQFVKKFLRSATCAFVDLETHYLH